MLTRLRIPFEILKFGWYERIIGPRADVLAFQSTFDEQDQLRRAPQARGKTVVSGALHPGMPVIGSRAGGIPDILAHDELLFDPMSGQAIHDRVLEIARDPAPYRGVRELCRGRAEAFRFDRAAAFAAAMPPADGPGRRVDTATGVPEA